MVNLQTILNFHLHTGSIKDNNVEVYLTYPFAFNIIFRIRIIQRLVQGNDILGVTSLHLT
jgi:benzoyl-CoA reductase/2-hydroxyglutaryl-CoA dehydratase subunit BcrC/BadD/HgdB